jgi:hypothetical protein
MGNLLVLDHVDPRNCNVYNREFSAYSKLDVIRQKRAEIHQKSAEKVDFSVIL